MAYIWEHDDWPNFNWDQALIAEPLAKARYKQGKLLGRLSDLGFPIREEALLQTLTDDVINTSEIEGQYLDRATVRSSIARRLGIDVGGLSIPEDRNVEGIVEVMLDATMKASEPLTAERLFSWHAAMFPTGRSGLEKIAVGQFRDDSLGAMQIVSGPYGRVRVHYQAPPAERVEQEMRRFLDWFNAATTIDPVLKAGLAHYWYVAIHPFDDGNGRIGRAIADMAIARSDHADRRFYSMSSQFKAEGAHYYNALETTSNGTPNITKWQQFFIQTVERALDRANESLKLVLNKAQFFHVHAGGKFNDRQSKIINKLFDGFEGNLTSSKWAKMTKCSQDTATRDINDLVKKGVLARSTASGRSTNYELIPIEQ